MLLSAVSMLALSLVSPALALLVPPFMTSLMPADSDNVHTYAEWSWTDCGLPSDPVTIHSIAVTPDPPEPGKTMTVNVTGTVKSKIEHGAYADVAVRLGQIKILSKTFDLCEEAVNANTTVQCPVDEGEYVVVQSVDLPKQIPPAKFKVSVQGYTVDDGDLVCLDILVSFMKR